MKTINNYLFESREISTSSNKERRKELEKWLKHKKYDDYVDTLNKMLEDPKAKSLLEDGFGGDLGDTKLNFSVKEITCQNLVPTQKEIDLDKSIKYILKNKSSIKETFDNPIEISKPIVTFRKNYIIDGHHSWLQALVLNPEGKMTCFNYDGDISPIQMLKTVQGTIASVKAKQDEKKLPSSKISGPNIFNKDFDEDKIRKYIKDNLDEDLIDTYVEFIEECYDYDTTVDFLVERLLDIKSNNYPLESSPKREDMPQVFKGGSKKDDKSSAYPDKEGSTLNKLKDDKFMKSITK